MPSLPEHVHVNHPAHDPNREQLLKALMGVRLLNVEPEVGGQSHFWIDDEPGRQHLSQQLKVKMAILHPVESPDVLIYLSELDELRKGAGLDELLAMGRKRVTNHRGQEPATLPARHLAAEMEVAEGMIILCETIKSRIVLFLGRSVGSGVFDARAEICGDIPLGAGDVLFRDVRNIDERFQRTICSVVETA
ncbi:MAG: hypothetical protein ABFD92_06105 [Planctomycetaceae bacterium]|nr:hypothetical protein [Planctomycetaceae bacterium]